MTGRTRRELLRDAGTVAAGATLMSLPAGSGALARRARRKQTVAIFGGGIAGLTAAHELIERGFAVTIYERLALGGKARSIPVPRTGRGGRADLPGEHGYRISLATYQYLPEMMARIPAGRGQTVADNLVGASDFLVARTGREDVNTFLTGPPATAISSPEALARELAGLLQFGADLPPAELAVLAQKLSMYLTSSDERRFGEWEYISMWDYFEAEGKSALYKEAFTGGLSHFIQSTPPKLAAARTHMNLYEAVFYSVAGLNTRGVPFARLLNAPTNEAWIDPWVRHLRREGVRFVADAEIERLTVDDRRIRSATVRRKGSGRGELEADWFVLAVPVERAKRLLGREAMKADSALEGVHRIPTRFMNGIQFFMREETPLNRGHIAYLNSPWVVSSVSQAQFWERDFASDYGDGEAKDCVSVIISDWRVPGILYGKPARECNKRQVADEVWAQMKAHLNDSGRERLSDDMVHSWRLDPEIKFTPRGTRSNAPLFIATPGLQDDRPESAGQIHNLFLASDYVRNRSAIDSATMDGATAAARAAVNALLERSSSQAETTTLYRPHTAPQFVAAKRADAERYRRGLPHFLDGS